MKPRGRHPHNALTAVEVRKITRPGKYADGGGLYLVVDPSGARRWVLRTVIRGKRREMGLGSADDVSLVKAREKARDNRSKARDGMDPIAARKAERAKPTFREAAALVHTDHAKGWRNGKHRGQWLATLELYAFPIIGDLRIDHIDTPDVQRVLSPIWLEKPETARRVKQRIGTVLDWAAAAGHRSSANPVTLVGRGLPKQTDMKRQKHHASMPYQDVPAFVASLPACDAGESVKLATEFAILTAARTGEVIGAKPEEFDLEAAVWVVPAERMKVEAEHRVPLSKRAVEVVRRALNLGGVYVFPGRRKSDPLSNIAMLKNLKGMGHGWTIHGFRSSFRTWAAEQTSFPREIIEAALAHTIESKVERAYQRSDLFEKRRALMQAWAGYVSGAEKVIRLRASNER